MDGLLPTPHEYNKHIHMGSQWALFMPSVVVMGVHKGPLVFTLRTAPLFRRT